MKTSFYFIVGCTGAGCLQHLCYEEACRDKHSRLSLIWDGQKQLREFSLRLSTLDGRCEGPQQSMFSCVFCLSLLESLLCVGYSLSQEVCVVSHLIFTRALQCQDHVWGHGGLGKYGLHRLCSWGLAALRKNLGPSHSRLPVSEEGGLGHYVCPGGWGQVSAGCRASQNMKRKLEM